jgi:hypothetical protein
MSIRSQLIKLTAAFGVVLAAAAFSAPAKAISVDLNGFDVNGTPTPVGVVHVGSTPVLLSIQLFPNYSPTSPGGGVDGFISVDVGAPIVSFVGFGAPFADPTALEVDGSPGVFTYLLTALNQDLNIVVTALLTPNDDGSFIGEGPFIRVTLEDVTSAVPVPGALPLFATGIGALGFMQWRRRRRVQAA